MLITFIFVLYSAFETGMESEITITKNKNMHAPNFAYITNKTKFLSASGHDIGGTVIGCSIVLIAIFFQKYQTKILKFESVSLLSFQAADMSYRPCVSNFRVPNINDLAIHKDSQLFRHP